MKCSWLPNYFPLVNLCQSRPRQGCSCYKVHQSTAGHLYRNPISSRLFTLLWSPTKSLVCVLPRWDLYFRVSLVNAKKVTGHSGLVNLRSEIVSLGAQRAIIWNPRKYHKEMKKVGWRPLTVSDDVVRPSVSFVLLAAVLPDELLPSSQPSWAGWLDASFTLLLAIVPGCSEAPGHCTQHILH